MLVHRFSAWSRLRRPMTSAAPTSSSSLSLSSSSPSPTASRRSARPSLRTGRRLSKRGLFGGWVVGRSVRLQNHCRIAIAPPSSLICIWRYECMLRRVRAMYTSCSRLLPREGTGDQCLHDRCLYNFPLLHWAVGVGARNGGTGRVMVSGGGGRLRSSCSHMAIEHIWSTGDRAGRCPAECPTS